MTRFSNVLTRLSFAAPIVPTPTLTLHPPLPADAHARTKKGTMSSRPSWGQAQYEQMGGAREGS